MITLLVLCAIITGIFIAKGHPEPAAQGCDHILVLGCHVAGDRPGPVLADRIARAYSYLAENPQTVAVLSGGKGEDERISEAECMRRELTARGIKAQRLWLEEKSTSTKENFLFSVECIREKSGTVPVKIGIVSSETHLFRSYLYAKRLGLESVGIPAKTGRLPYRLYYFLREIPCVWNQMIFGG